jgi:hypothetical protein
MINAENGDRVREKGANPYDITKKLPKCIGSFNIINESRIQRLEIR